MSSESTESVNLVFNAVNAGRFTKDVEGSELALRRQARALDDSSRALQREITELKAAISPNKQLIQAKMQLLQQTRLQTQEMRAHIRALNEESAAKRKNAAETKILQGNAVQLTSGMRSLIGVFSSLTALLSAGAILKTADQFNQLSSRVKNSLDDVRDFDKVFQQLVDSSNRSGTAIDAVAQAFVRLRPAAAELGVTNDQLIKFNETFVKMGALAGATGEEVKNAMIQLSQGLASGTLRGDELRSVLEQMPGIARIIATELKIPFKDLRQAAEDGKISAEAVFNAILKKSDEVDKQFAALPQSLDRVINRVVNSFTVMIGKVNQTAGVTENLAKVVNGLADQLDGMSQSGNAGNNILLNLAGTVNSLIGAFQGVVNLIGLVTPFFDAVAVGARVAAFGIESVVLNLQELSIRAGSIFSNLGKFNQNGAGIQAKLDADIAKLYGDAAARNADLLGLDTKIISSQLPRPRQKPDKQNFPGYVKPKKAKKTADTTGRDESRAVGILQSDLRDSLTSIDLSFDTKQLNIGAFVTEQQKLNVEAEKNDAQLAKLVETQKKLRDTTFKSKEGSEAQRKALADLANDITKAKNTALDLSNQQDKLAFETREATNEIERQTESLNRSSALDRIRDRIANDQQDIQRAFEQNKISLEDYYNAQLSLIDQTARLEKYELSESIKLLEEKKKALESVNDSGLKDLEIKQLQLEILRAKAGYDQIDINAANSTKDARIDKENIERQAGDQFKQATQQALSTAISDALTGQGVGNALKKFAKTMRDALVNAFAEAISKRIVNFFDNAFQGIGGIFNKISGSTSGSNSQSSSVASLTSGVGGLSLTGGQGGANATNKLNKNLTKLQGAITGIASIGAAFGIGQSSGSPLIGGIGGALAGGIGGAVTAGAIYGSALGPVGTAVGAGIGAIVGAGAGIFGGLFGGKKKKEQEKAIKQQAIAQGLVQTALSGADQNNLFDLQSRLGALLGNNRGLRGDAVRIVRDGALQLQQLIAARQKAIEEGLKELDRQNLDLRDEIAKIGADAGTVLEINYKAQLRTIENETQRLLDEFKDSEEAKTKILEQQTLKRELLQKQEQAAAKQTVDDLRALLEQRDDIANANVFTRRESVEQQKAKQITQLDQEIAQKVLENRKNLELGITPLNSLGLNQIQSLAGASTVTNAQLQIIIDGATDPMAVSEAVTRAFQTFWRKTTGAELA